MNWREIASELVEGAVEGAVTAVVRAAREAFGRAAGRLGGEPACGYVWAAVSREDAPAFVRRNPDMLGGQAFYESQMARGEPGERVIVALAPELAVLEARHPGKTLFVKLV